MLTYQHPCKDPTKFNDLYLQNLLDNKKKFQEFVDKISYRSYLIKQNWNREFFREYNNNNFRPLCTVSAVKEQQFIYQGQSEKKLIWDFKKIDNKTF